MALQSPIDLMGLHSADGYWKLLSLQYDERTSTIVVDVGGYATQAMRESGLDQNVVVRQERMTLDLTNPAHAHAFDTVKGMLYAALKKGEFFASATDVIEAGAAAPTVTIPAPTVDVLPEASLDEPLDMQQIPEA